MSRRLLAPALALALGPVLSAPAQADVRAGDAVASVSGATATLSNRHIARTWAITPGGPVVTSSLSDPATGRGWSRPSSPDFLLTLNQLPTTSTQGWALERVEAQPIPGDPARPDAGAGVQLLFRYAAGAVPPAGDAPIELDRTYTLHPGDGVMGVSSTLVNRTPAPLRVGKYTLAELTTPGALTAEVQAYHGGTDWRDDYRAVSRPTGPFDSEGEVLRLDDGRGEGIYFVSERRGGSMNRVGLDASGRAFAEVDSARDAFDWGPLMSSPPSYNRQDNPAYPAPVRERTVGPLSSLYLGRAYLGVYHGGAGEAAARFASYFADHEMPHFARSVGLNSFHPWSHGPGVSDANLRQQADALKALGGETFMIDDSWQGGTGGVSGDWNFNPARFPTTGGGPTPDFVKYLHSIGMKLGLWMSPVEFNPNSQTYAAHPDWACTPTGHVTAQVGGTDPGLGVWDVDNPGFRTYLKGVVDRLIRDDGVGEFKFDFQTWVDCPPHDYLDYEQGFVSLVREMEAAHPEVTFEFDETNDQRMWPFESVALGPSWFDNDHTHGSTTQAKQLHDLWSAAPWMAPSTIGFGLYDGTLGGQYTAGYLMPMAILGHVTFWTDLTQLSAADRAETAWWISWYEAHRDALGGAVYEDTTADPIDGTSWAALQPWRHGAGYLFAFRQGGAAASQSIALQGVRGDRSYTVTDVRTGQVLGTYTGAQLAAGLTVTLPAPYTALVASVTPA